MFKVILLGDTDYEQSHVVTQITKVNLHSLCGCRGTLYALRTSLLRSQRQHVAETVLGWMAGDPLSEEGGGHSHLR